MHFMNKDLPGLVKQRYGTEMRSQTLASIKLEISQAIDTLLAALQTIEDTKIMWAGAQTSQSIFN